MTDTKERRERIATAVLAGLVADSASDWARLNNNAAERAVALADALIAELDKEEQK